MLKAIFTGHESRSRLEKPGRLFLGGKGGSRGLGVSEIKG